ncbi:MAG: protease [Acidobacteria bacterium]|nr:protease [Acidobacteriota bacterium]
MSQRALTAVLALALTAALLGAAPAAAAAPKPVLAQHPSLSRTHIVFASAGDLWVVGREGGRAARLTRDAGDESRPCFSPDGTLVAFSGQYDGNTDVFVVPAAGGIPRRLTHHPDADEVVGWTPDGRRVLFRSGRASGTVGLPALYTVGLEGGFPEALPLPTAVEGSYSADGTRLAYVPTQQWQPSWKRYQGGQTTPVWLVTLADLKVEKLPRENSNDSNPLWIGDKIYFLSDRRGPVSLFVYDTATKKVDRALPNGGLDFKSAAAGPGGIVIEQFGALHLFDPATGQASPVPVTLEGDLPEVRPHYVKVGGRIAAAGLSPNGARAVFEARGEILTVPAEKGDVRNLTRTTGVMERDPSWSPDGRSVAYFSDESGEYALHVRDQSGQGPVRKIGLGLPPSFFYRPLWSPDGKKIAYNDKRLNLWYVDLDKGVPVKVDTTYYFNPQVAFEFEWSPDSRWLTYSKQVKSHMFVVMVYSLETGKATQVTDGMSDARFPVFDKSGKHLFFAASTDVGLTPGWLNMASMDRPYTRSVYVAVLRKDLPSPLAPESDDEKPKEEEKKAEAPKAEAKKGGEKDKADEKPKEAEKVVIDFDGLGQRILALPIPARNYVAMAAGKEGLLFILEGSQVPAATSGVSQPPVLHKFDLTTRKLDKFLEGIGSFVLSATGEKILFSRSGQWTIAGTAGPAEPGKGALDTGAMEVRVEPLVEWKQMYHETWRIERDFFYDAGLHGLDLAAIEKRYLPYLEAVSSRQDLNYLFEEMLGELTCGHVFVNGGDLPEVKRVGVGLLGADYAVENGRYRFARVFDGENWNPRLRAPLTQPGVNVKAGEYLLAVNGREVAAAEEVYAPFEATAGKQTLIKVGPSPDGKGAREVTVVPTGNEYGLRNLAWVEANRRKVDEMSGGKLAYVWLPDTADGGYTNFNRYYFAQIGKDGVVVDERFNQGGLIADYIIDYLRRPLMGYFASRDGADYITPVGSIYGPKVMIINEYAGSGGDMMPWLFRAAGIGPLVGKRTWGGLVGMAGAAPLMDSGFTGAPQSGFWNPNGTWDVENHGVDPDYEVEMDPAAVKAGRDPQLEKAVQVALELLQKNPPPKHVKPAYPDYQKKK